MFYAAISLRVYRHTLPHLLLMHLFGEDFNEGPFSALVLLRKFYSIVAFALIGFVVDKALPATRRPALRAALIVAAFSAVIEVVQKLHGAREGPLSEAIDIACGAIGGWLAVTIARWVGDRRRA
jgi:hypothetical protein